MNRFRHPVVQISPTDAVIVAEHVTLADARQDAAMRDAADEPGVWYFADEHGCHRDHAWTH